MWSKIRANIRRSIAAVLVDLSESIGTGRLQFNMQLNYIKRTRILFDYTYVCIRSYLKPFLQVVNS